MGFLPHRSFVALRAVMGAFVLPLAVAEAKAAPVDAVVGELVDIARFGTPLAGDGTVGVEWANPHRVSEVRVAGVDAGLAESLRVEWWGSIWPANGHGGWMRLDDQWNGKWVRVDARPEPGESGQLLFRFPPLTRQEWDKEPRPPMEEEPTYRKTLKVRVVARGKSIPRDMHLSVFGSSRWREASFDVETRCSREGPVTGSIEITNGVLVSLESLLAPREVDVVEGSEWSGQCRAGGSTGVRIRLRYSDDADRNSNGLTRVTVRLGAAPGSTGFSFVPRDVLKEGAIRLPSLATLVSETSRGMTLANDPGPTRAHWSRPVRLRLNERPEMTRTMAMAGIPRLTPARDIPIGVPSARQELFVGPRGDWSIWALSLNTDNGRDAQRWAFAKQFGTERLWGRLVALLDTREQPQFDGGDREGTLRYLEDGSLPLVHVKWHRGPLRFHHALAATTLLGDYGDDVTRRGDETVVLLTRLAVTNAARVPHAATVNLRYSRHVPLVLKDDGTIAIEPPDGVPVPEGLSPLYGQISMDKAAGGGAAGWTMLPAADEKTSAILRWQATLQPGETRLIHFKAPFVELLDAEEMKRLKEIDFDKEVPRVLDYWRERFTRGMQIDVPDPALNNFYKANLWHNVITTDRDPETGLYNQGVGTVQYRVFGNETVMIARSMDMRGEHLEAERFIEPFMHYQGDKALKGRFSTKDGAFHSAGAYTHGEYAMNHGFVMWGAADHFLLTGDRAYLDRVAPKLIKGCDFLISQRASTMGEDGSPRSRIHGLTPASSLEDVVEYKYWFAVNGYYYLGMKRVAQALAAIGHPQAERIAAEAEEYRRDIETAVREATTRSAVVRILDGSFIPYVPSRVFQWRHLTEGWIRESLYPALHLATAEVVSPDDPLMTWMLDDLEDIIFFSGASGYGVDYERTWFERGALTPQPCLLDTPTVYMARDEIAAALRSFWNTYALLIYPDVHCFAEWAPDFGRGGGPVYKTSDESRFVMWLRQLLVWEDGDRLWLARAAPREWLQNGKVVRIADAPTLFGRVGLTIRSYTDQGKIQATVSLPTRSGPREAWLRLRHPLGHRLRAVYIDGQLVEPERIVGEDIRLIPGVSDTSRPVEVTAEY